MGIRTSHVIAAFIGTIALAYVRFDGGMPGSSNLSIVFWGAVIFGMGWECIVRLLALFKQLLTGERPKRWTTDEGV